MKFKIICLLLIIFMPISVKANELIEFECKKNDKVYVCDVIGNFDETVNAVDFKISYPSYIKSNEFTLENNLFGSTDDNWVSIIFEKPVYGRKKLGVISLETKKLNVKDIKISDLKIIDKTLAEKEININNDVNSKKYNKTIIIIVIICGTIIVGIIILMKKLRGVTRK